MGAAWQCGGCKQQQGGNVRCENPSCSKPPDEKMHEEADPAAFQVNVSLAEAEAYRSKGVFCQTCLYPTCNKCKKEERPRTHRNKEYDIHANSFWLCELCCKDMNRCEECAEPVERSLQNQKQDRKQPDRKLLCQRCRYHPCACRQRTKRPQKNINTTWK